MRANPFLRGDFEAAFSRPAILRTYMYFLAAMSAILFFWWPRNPPAVFVRDGAVPSTFAAAALGLLACVAYLGARLGAEDFPAAGAASLRDLVTLTPTPVLGLVAGKMAVGVVHTLFLLGLGLPFLAASRGVSGVPPGATAQTLLVAGSWGLAFRALGFLFLTLLESRPALKDVFLLFCSLALALLPTVLLPVLGPVTAMRDIGMAGRTAAAAALSPAALSSSAGLLAALVFSGGALAVLAAARRRPQ